MRKEIEEQQKQTENRELKLSRKGRDLRRAENVYGSVSAGQNIETNGVGDRERFTPRDQRFARTSIPVH